MNTQQIRKYIFHTQDIVELQNHLQKNPQIDISQLKDKEGNHILHQCAFRNQLDKMKLFINHIVKVYDKKIQESKAIYKKNVQQQVQVLINQPNSQGFTPLLYAAYNGHIECLKYLQNLGANINALTKTNINSLHLAAQNNKVSTFIHLYGRIDINSEDINKSTPLHWSAYLGSDQVASFILAQKNVQVNKRDKDGQTPLILATSYGNTKIVRKLLLKGASRKMKNKQGKLPIQIAQQLEYRNIQKMLNDKYTLFDMIKFYCNVKVQYKPQHRSVIMPIIFVITTIITYAILHGLLIFQQQYQYAIIIFSGITLFALYFTLLFPSKLHHQKEYSDFTMKEISTNKVCYQCRKLIPKRGYHCDICHICIEQYDHHCTWINNCVGKKNIGRFIIFLLILVLSLGMIGLISVTAILQLLIKGNQFDYWYKFRQNFKQDTNLIYFGQIALLIINGIISLFFFPVLLLLIIQIKNIFMNKTTYERFKNSSYKQQPGSVKDMYSGNKSKISMKNCRMMCGKSRQSMLTNQLNDQLL